jgi:hypothetical protein
LGRSRNSRKKSENNANKLNTAFLRRVYRRREAEKREKNNKQRWYISSKINKKDKRKQEISIKQTHESRRECTESKQQAD